MRVSHLTLTDFRNYAHAEVSLVSGSNLFVGRNGQGKTNLVESLGYLSTLGSHRTSTDAALIRQGADAAIVRARLQHEPRELLIEAQLNRSGANRAQVNRSPVKPRELPRYFSSILFAPEDLALIRGEPSVRRRFLDQLLVQRTPRLAGVMADYERVVKQRNTLLKSARASRVHENQLTTLDIWDERLVSLGSEIVRERITLLGDLDVPVRLAYESVAGADHSPHMSASLSTSAEDEQNDNLGTAVNALIERREGIDEEFRTALQRRRRAELERGLTLVGPHRDDFPLQLNRLPAKGYASHGESWSLALALKLASAELLRSTSTTGDPVLILDDVFAELDSGRRRMLATAVADYEQVLITAAVFEDVPDALRAHTVRIAAGTIIDPALDTEEGSDIAAGFER